MGAPRSIAKGYVIYGPFPFSVRMGGAVAGKNRPALVLARTSEGDLIACQITSREHPASNADVSLGDTDFAQGRLQRDSFIRADKIFTLDRDVSVNVVGILTDHKVHEVVAVIVGLLQS